MGFNWFFGILRIAFCPKMLAVFTLLVTVICVAIPDTGAHFTAKANVQLKAGVGLAIKDIFHSFLKALSSMGTQFSVALSELTLKFEAKVSYLMGNIQLLEKSEGKEAEALAKKIVVDLQALQAGKELVVEQKLATNNQVEKARLEELEVKLQKQIEIMTKKMSDLGFDINYKGKLDINGSGQSNSGVYNTRKRTDDMVESIQGFSVAISSIVKKVNMLNSVITTQTKQKSDSKASVKAKFSLEIKGILETLLNLNNKLETNINVAIKKYETATGSSKLKAEADLAKLRAEKARIEEIKATAIETQKKFKEISDRIDQIGSGSSTNDNRAQNGEHVPSTATITGSDDTDVKGIVRENDSSTKIKIDQVELIAQRDNQFSSDLNTGAEYGGSVSGRSIGAGTGNGGYDGSNVFINDRKNIEFGTGITAITGAFVSFLKAHTLMGTQFSIALSELTTKFDAKISFLMSNIELLEKKKGKAFKEHSEKIVIDLQALQSEKELVVKQHLATSNEEERARLEELAVRVQTQIDSMAKKITDMGVDINYKEKLDINGSGQSNSGGNQISTGTGSLVASIKDLSSATSAIVKKVNKLDSTQNTQTIASFKEKFSLEIKGVLGILVNLNNKLETDINVAIKKRATATGSSKIKAEADLAKLRAEKAKVDQINTRVIQTRIRFKEIVDRVNKMGTDRSTIGNGVDRSEIESEVKADTYGSGQSDTGSGQISTETGGSVESIKGLSVAISAIVKKLNMLNSAFSTQTYDSIASVKANFSLEINGVLDKLLKLNTIVEYYINLAVKDSATATGSSKIKAETALAKLRAEKEKMDEINARAIQTKIRFKEILDRFEKIGTDRSTTGNGVEQSQPNGTTIGTVSDGTDANGVVRESASFTDTRIDRNEQIRERQAQFSSESNSGKERIGTGSAGSIDIGIGTRSKGSIGNGTESGTFALYGTGNEYGDSIKGGIGSGSGSKDGNGMVRESGSLTETRIDRSEHIEQKQAQFSLESDTG